jgi:DNA-binding NarL/FixJ family response regulator
MKKSLTDLSPILIIEDQASLAMMIQQKLQSALPDHPCFVASSQTEALQILDQHTEINFCIADLHLPDSPDGDIVPKLIERGITTVVLTNTFKDEIRLKMYEMKVADFVVKDGQASVDYAISCIYKLLTNHNKIIWTLCDQQNETSGLIQQRL